MNSVDSVDQRFIAPGGTLGVLGGGQLGRMFVQAAQEMGYGVVVLDPEAVSPAGLTAYDHIATPYESSQGLTHLADRCDAVTTEFENVPAHSLAWLAQRRPVAPLAEAVKVCQDRMAEKAHFLRSRVSCAPHCLIDGFQALEQVEDDLLPGILKTVRWGYDGKGQVHVQTREELSAAWNSLAQAPCLLEKKLPLSFEISVIVARRADGKIVHLPVQHNLHREGILAVTRVPAPGVSAELAEQALSSARRLAASLNYVGVLCVEFFVLQDGSLLANEMAPRPHNSGHYSIDACDISQFELQVRTLTNSPLVQPRLHSSAVMLNLLGDLWWAGGSPQTPPWDDVLALPGVHLHLYGKTEPRPGRKMGHLTVTAPKLEEAELVARKAAEYLGLPSF
jgi:5-(carboxyamino)imidazole ribonucleotide synthase